MSASDMVRKISLRCSSALTKSECSSQASNSFLSMTDEYIPFFKKEARATDSKNRTAQPAALGTLAV